MRAKTIKIYESSIDKVNINNIINKKTIDYIMMDNWALDLLVYQYIEEEYLEIEPYSEEAEEIKDTKAFNDYVLYEIQYRANEFINNEVPKIISNNNTIKLYRKITVDNKWLNHLKNNPNSRLGIYWSYDKSAAEAHWGLNKPILASIETEVKEEYVDWDETIRLNANPNNGDEKEIRLFKNTPIIIKNIEIDGNPIDIVELKNKTYRT